MKVLNTKILILALAFIGLSATTAYAYDFSAVNNDGVTIYYNITSATAPMTVEVARHSSYTGNVVIPASVTDNGNTYSVTGIAEMAFTYCNGLTSVTIPEPVTTVGRGAFNMAVNLATVYFNAVNCQTIGEVNASGDLPPAFFGAGNNLSAASVIIGENVQRIPDLAFAGFNKLSSVNLPNSLTYIGQYAFWSCRGITSISIPSSITSLSASVFQDCGLISITIPNTIQTIGIQAFALCPLKKAVLGNGLLSIGNAAFATSGSLDTLISLATTAPTLGQGVFRATSGQTQLGSEPNIPVRVPCGKVSDYQNAEGWNYFTNFYAESGEPQKLCMISVNNNNHNEIFWQQNGEVGSYNIYREGSTSGQYELIGNVPYGSATSWVDTQSDASTRSYRYKVAGVSSCNDNEVSPLSPLHRTMHLTISQGVGSAWNLIWTEYEGVSFSTYNIWRGASADFASMTQIGIMASGNTTFTDNSAPSGNVYYVVEIVLNNGCEVSQNAPAHSPRQNAPAETTASIRSNVATNSASGINDVLENSIAIYPNPVNDELFINLLGFENLTGLSVQIVDVSGRSVGERLITPLTNGTATINVSALPAGIYFIKIVGSNIDITQKFIKK